MKNRHYNHDLFPEDKPQRHMIDYVPCARPPFAEITQDFISDRLMYIHDAALSEMKPNYAAAVRAIEILVKMKGFVSGENVGTGQPTESAVINFIGIKSNNAGD